MDIRALMMRTIDLQKSSFDNGYEAFVTIQDEVERIMTSYMEQAVWIPPASRGVMTEWFSAMRKNRDDFKKAVDDGYKQMNNYYNSALGRTYTF